MCISNVLYIVQKFTFCGKSIYIIEAHEDTRRVNDKKKSHSVNKMSYRMYLAFHVYFVSGTKIVFS